MNGLKQCCPPIIRRTDSDSASAKVLIFFDNANRVALINCYAQRESFRSFRHCFSAATAISLVGPVPDSSPSTSLPKIDPILADASHEPSGSCLIVSASIVIPISESVKHWMFWSLGITSHFSEPGMSAAVAVFASAMPGR